MTHAHTGSTSSTVARTSRSAPIGELRMVGMPRPMRTGSSRWFGAGLVALLASIGGLSAYQVMSSKHPELVSIAPLVTPQQDAPSAPASEPIVPIDETAPAPPTQPAPSADPPRLAPVPRETSPATTREKPVTKAPAPLPDKPEVPAAEPTPPVQVVTPAAKESESLKVNALKPEAPKTEAVSATAIRALKPAAPDSPTPKVTIET